MEGDAYRFKGGFPTPETIQTAYDDIDLNRAVQTYRFFYPTVSAAAVVEGSRDVGLVPNRKFGALETQPRHRAFTPTSDAPCGTMLVDLSAGPVVIELPAGPLVLTAVDANQRGVADMGTVGPDEGRGGAHVVLPPGHAADPPADAPPGAHAWRSTTSALIVTARALPVRGDVAGALARIREIKVHPLAAGQWREPEWLGLSDRPQDTTPVAWETTLRFWEVLHRVVDAEPPFGPYHAYYGELAALGIAQGRPFAPDARIARILAAAAKIGNGQLRVEAFADRRPDRVVWKDRQWEWPALRADSADFDAGAHADLEARDKWFYHAVGASPARFRRSPGADSLCWLGLRDRAGAYLDGRNSYRLTLPQPVPAKQLWSVTVYDPETRSELQTSLNRAALRSLHEMKDDLGDAVTMYFGPYAPEGREGAWVETIPGKGWFAYLRLYGPVSTAFDGSWRPGDFEPAR